VTANGVPSFDQSRKRIRRAIEERESFERYRYAYRLNRASLIARMFDGLAIGLGYVLLMGFLIGYQTERQLEIRQTLLAFVILALVAGRSVLVIVKDDPQ
jgi:hypothetical protein